jgi:hypothetical protein
MLNTYIFMLLVLIIATGFVLNHRSKVEKSLAFEIVRSDTVFEDQ